MALMGSKAMALFLLLNLAFLSCVSAYCPAVPSTPVTPTPSPPTYKRGKCPVNTLKLGACVDLVNGLVSLVVGTPPSKPCCSLVSGLVDLEAAACLCTAVKLSALGINLNIPITLSLLVSACATKIPAGYKCA